MGGLCQQTREALGRYLGFRAGTPLLTETQRGRLLKKARRGDLHPLKLDVNTRAILYQGRPARGRRWPARGRRWPDPLLPDLIIALSSIWEKATGRSPRTRDPQDGVFPFFDWVSSLFEAAGQKAPKQYIVRDMLKLKLKKSPP
jgi:hypothetical protein